MQESNKKNDSKITVVPSDYQDCSTFLKDLYEARKQSDQQYSYMQLAEDLGFSRTNIIYQFIKKIRPISFKAAEKISDNLKLKGLERRYFLALVKLYNTKEQNERQHLLEKLLEIKSQDLVNEDSQRMLEYFKEWYHPVIREMVALADFQDNPQWISERMFPRPRVEKIAESLELLKRLGYIRYDDQKNRYVQSEPTINTGVRAPGISLVNYHHKMIALSSDSITTHAPEDRQIGAITICVSHKKMEQIKNKIHTFQLEILKETEDTADAQEVYQLNIQFFPFTKVNRKS